MKKRILYVALACLSLAAFNTVFAQSYAIKTVAGNGTANYFGDGGQATAAELDNPVNVAMDTIGNIYIADATNNRVRKVSTSGIITTIAGNGTANFFGDGGQATAAELDRPTAIAIDAAGNIYIADQLNNRIRKVNTSGVISTIAGNGTANYSGDGGPATAAELNTPMGVAVSSGNVYIADLSNNRVRKIDRGDTITTIAGNGTAGYSGDGGPATAAKLKEPINVTIDPAGNVFIADYQNNRIRKVNTGDTITTFAGNGTASFSGDGGPAVAAELNAPVGIAIDAMGNVYIGDYGNNRVRKVNTSGIITTIGGSGAATFSGDGGPAIAAGLNSPDGITTNASGSTIYIASIFENRVRELTRPNINTASKANVKCNGNANGKIVTMVTGGIGSYTYSWAPTGGSADSATGLSAGTYTLTVVDSIGDSTLATYTITQPATLAATVSSNPTTGSSCNGIAWAAITGGTAPYTYLWSPSAGTTDTINSLCNGTYCCTITDKNGCIDSNNCTTITGIAQINASAGVNIYPNPFSGKLTVSWVQADDAVQSIEIYNMLGKKVYAKTISEQRNTCQVNLSNLAAGLYMIRVTTQSGQVVAQDKVMKTN